jgi:prevent-host-death family protein
MIEVTVSELRERVSDLLGQVQHGREDVTIMKHGKPVAVVIPVEAYEFYEKLWDEQMLRELAEERASPDYDPNDTMPHEEFWAELLKQDAAE